MSQKNVSGFRGYPLPVGAVIPTFAITATEGFLLCDGASYFISDYPVLASVLGTIYGGSAGIFQVPNLVNQLVEGSAINANVITPPSAGALAIDFTLTESNIPSFVTNTSANFVGGGTTDLHNIITSNSSQATTGGSPTSTFLEGVGATASTPPSVNLSSTVVSGYVGTNAPVSAPVVGSPLPAGYSVRYLIKADYPF